jgi:GNAT superfamily N-acetyltransferase
MSELTIRPAVAEDCATIAEFNCRIAEETEGKTLVSETIRAGVAALLADPAKGRYFLACDGDDVVGQLMHTREWSDWRNGDLWWLQSVYVRAEYRGRGVFRRLYEHVRSLAEGDPKVAGIRLYVERDNAAAQSVYARMGMKQAGYFVMEALFRDVPRLSQENQQ